MSLKNSESFIKLTQASEKSLSECLIKNLPINIFLVDKEGYVCWANDNLLEFLSLTLQEVEGKHISSWDHTRWEYVYEVIMNKQETVHEEVYQDKHFSTIRRPVFDEEGEVVGALGVAVEITDRKKAEIAKEQFLHNIRHDIRTPLSGIIGLATILKNAIENPELLSLLNALEETSEALLTLLDRVFESIQLTTGEIAIRSDRFSLKDTLTWVYKLHYSKALEKNLTLRFDYDSFLPHVVIGQAIPLQRIVWELLTNALKYTEKGSIELNARLVEQLEDKVKVEIEVKDTGIGIPFDQHETIFGIFTRLTPAWTKTLGQGLGLFNVKKLIEELKGEIILKSSLDEGSTFICRITFDRADT